MKGIGKFVMNMSSFKSEHVQIKTMRHGKIKGGNMRNIYKKLISVLTILILTIGFAAKPISTTNQAEQIQDDRLTALEANGTLQQINNSEQQGLIDGLVSDIGTIKTQILSLIDQISSLSNRLTNLENSPYPAMYGKWDPNPKLIETIESGTINGVHFSNPYSDISNLTFDLPTDANVSIKASGVITNFSAGDNDKINMTVDTSDNLRGFTEPNYQISRIYRLKAGSHTIYLRGGSTSCSKIGSGPVCNSYAIYTSIEAIATDKGSFYIIE
jgi:hypothetical protein